MKILVALDRSEYGRIVAEHGLDQAKRERADELHFVTAVDTDETSADARADLEELTSELVSAFGFDRGKVRLHVRTGAPTETVAQLAQELAPDLLVIGRFSVPSSANAILERVGCPILVVGIEGDEVAPQCPACAEVRRDTGAERLFCDQHTGDRLFSRVPHTGSAHSRLW